MRKILKIVQQPYASGKWKLRILWDFILSLSKWLRLKKKGQMTTNSGMYVGKEEHLLIVGGNANWYRNYKNQCRKDRHRFTTISSCTML